jgi:hypothetical protein
MSKLSQPACKRAPQAPPQPTPCPCNFPAHAVAVHGSHESRDSPNSATHTTQHSYTFRTSCLSTQARAAFRPRPPRETSL